LERPGIGCSGAIVTKTSAWLQQRHILVVIPGHNHYTRPAKNKDKQDSMQALKCQETHPIFRGTVVQCVDEHGEHGLQEWKLFRVLPELTTRLSDCSYWLYKMVLITLFWFRVSNVYFWFWVVDKFVDKFQTTTHLHISSRSGRQRFT